MGDCFIERYGKYLLRGLAQQYDADVFHQNQALLLITTRSSAHRNVTITPYTPNGDRLQGIPGDRISLVGYEQIDSSYCFYLYHIHTALCGQAVNGILGCLRAIIRRINRLGRSKLIVENVEWMFPSELQTSSHPTYFLLPTLIQHSVHELN